MVNITRLRQEERMMKIKRMEKSIKSSKNPDLKKLMMLCCKEWGLSKRTAQEYLEQALFNIESDKK